MTIAVLSTSSLPSFLGSDHPDERALFSEDYRLVDALAARGLEAQRVAWRQPDAAVWHHYDYVLVRSTWDYIDDVPAFLNVIAAIEHAGCRLVNTRALIEWNIDKRYLASLADAGCAVVPTQFIEPDEPAEAVASRLADTPGGWVVKPLVGVGAFGAQRVRNHQELVTYLAANRGEQTVIVQPFVASIVEQGEISFVFGGGQFLYAASKVPKPGDFRVQVMYGASTSETDPSDADLAAAQKCCEFLPSQPDFVRIDMARLSCGSLALMEAELIEPQLYLNDIPKAAGLLADVVVEMTNKT